MQKALLALGFSVILGLEVQSQEAFATDHVATETIVLIRHGEKPALGLGQLNCQGLNRALALPSVMQKMFGKPDLIFAPNPGQTKNDYGRPYNYIRPLATVEPTAIALGMPVDASIGVADIDALKNRLDRPDYRSALILIAWEHNEIVKIARHLMADHGGDPATVPEWKGRDFDSIYVVKVQRTGERTAATFEQHKEGLDGQATSCPQAASGQ